MSKFDWESKWEKYTLSFASTISNTHKDETRNSLALFLQTSVILSNFLVPSLVTFIKESKLTSSDFNFQQLEKKLYKCKRQEVEQLIKFFLMDYFSSILDNPTNLQLLDSRKYTAEIFIKELGLLMNFSKKEIAVFNDVVDKKNTFYHSIQLLEKLHLGKNARNEGLIEGIELIKEEIFNQLDSTLMKFLGPN